MSQIKCIVQHHESHQHRRPHARFGIFRFCFLAAGQPLSAQEETGPAEAPAALVSVSVPDFTATRERFFGWPVWSGLGTCGASHIRADFDQEMASERQRNGFSPMDILASTSWFRLEWFGLQPGRFSSEPTMVVAADLGELMDVMWPKLVAESNPAPSVPPGFDGALVPRGAPSGAMFLRQGPTWLLTTAADLPLDPRPISFFRHPRCSGDG